MSEMENETVLLDKQLDPSCALEKVMRIDRKHSNF